MFLNAETTVAEIGKNDVFKEKFPLSRGRKEKFPCVRMADDVAAVGKSSKPNAKITFSLRR